MMWYNSKSSELQSTPPWGASYIAQEVIEELYLDWQQVSDDFIPSMPILTKEQKLVALDAEYESQFTELAKAWATASMCGNNVLSDEIKIEYAKLKEEYNTKQEAIKNDR
ncbi:hypothetical protein [Pelosinus sp. IPA-1]|uniref:hypothetical protein n=1 Tax=Pelosinus sp. IPA-1 TaxID=3029569 RepID=UPI00243625E7|nr:hypothetical protein [Pelosinus sp. IPA-1]GMB00243.1 hypothetical protein PIPA1_30420 [Pelosinus sp. IPA-1]